MFPYFADPVNFSYLREDEKPCHFCGATSHRLDGDGFFGTEVIDAVCFACLEQGALIDLDISTNAVDLELVHAAIGDTDTVEELTNTIVYRTPSLPTWQDRPWPFVDGDFATFIKIAAKPDFAGQSEFVDSILGNKSAEVDAQWLWSILPEHPISKIEEGQYSVSVYLFRRGERLVTIWDAN